MKPFSTLASTLAAACLLLATCASATADTGEPAALAVQVDPIFAGFDADDRPGAAVAVWHHGTRVFSKGYGSANLEYGIPVTPDDTIFHVASISKQFTVYAILLLEAEGKLELNDPIRDYVPEVPDFGTPITLRHLATHTSGLRDQWDLLYLAGWRLDDVITTEHIMRLVSRQQALNFEPGAEYAYSNTGFTLLAETVARVSGLSFVDFTRERIFAPLGMAHTFFYDDHEKIVPNRAYSYSSDGDGDGLKKSVLSFSNAGATSLFTTAEDLLAWAAHLNNPPSPDIEAIVSQMNTPAVLNNGETFGGAYGQFLSPYRGLEQIEHGGADAGYRAYLARFPGQDFAVAVLSNFADSQPRRLALDVAEVFLREQMTVPAGEAVEGAPAAEGSAAPPTITLSNEALAAYEGYFWLAEGNTYRRVVLRDGGLVYARPA